MWSSSCGIALHGHSLLSPGCDATDPSPSCVGENSERARPNANAGAWGCIRAYTTRLSVLGPVGAGVVGWFLAGIQLRVIYLYKQARNRTRAVAMHTSGCAVYISPRLGL